MNPKFGQIYASCSINDISSKLEVSFQVPFAQGFVLIADNSINFSCETKDGIVGPKQMQFVENYKMAFVQEHNWTETEKDSRIYKSCSVCGVSFSMKNDQGNFYERLSLASCGIAEFCDMQIFHNAIIKIGKEFKEDEAWTVPFDSLEIPKELADRLDGYASLYFIMQQ